MADACQSCGHGEGYACNRSVCGRDRFLHCTARVSSFTVEGYVDVPAGTNKQVVTDKFLSDLTAEFCND
jgi:hypothetical protein